MCLHCMPGDSIQCGQPHARLHGIQAFSGRDTILQRSTGCTFDPSTNQGTCLTGDCGSNQLECSGSGVTPPATLAEFTVGTASLDSKDFYDVSLVDGYNLPGVMEPSGGSGMCLSTGCMDDLNRKFPSVLRVGSGDGCRSACEAFGAPEYCCSATYRSPDTCKPPRCSRPCAPRSYSYTFDDASSTFTCFQADYTITFWPSLLSSLKSATGSGSTAGESNGGTSTTGTHKDDGGSWLSNFFLGNSGTATSVHASSIGLIILANRSPKAAQSFSEHPSQLAKAP